jgi:hypothetical protein
MIWAAHSTRLVLHRHGGQMQIIFVVQNTVPVPILNTVALRQSHSPWLLYSTVILYFTIHVVVVYSTVLFCIVYRVQWAVYSTVKYSTQDSTVLHVLYYFLYFLNFTLRLVNDTAPIPKQTNFN